MRSFAKTLSVLVFFGGITTLWADAPTTKPMSPSEMSMSAAGIVSGIQDDHQRIVSLREQARKMKDVIKLNCVNDKLVEANAQMNIADSANEALKASLQKSGGDSQTQFQSLASAGQSVKQLREGASACIGAPELSKQESGVVVTHPDIPDDPQTDDPMLPTSGTFGTIEPPNYASAAH